MKFRHLVLLGLMTAGAVLYWGFPVRFNSEGERGTRLELHPILKAPLHIRSGDLDERPNQEMIKEPLPQSPHPESPLPGYRGTTSPLLPGYRGGAPSLEESWRTYEETRDFRNRKGI